MSAVPRYGSMRDRAYNSHSGDYWKLENHSSLTKPQLISQIQDAGYEVKQSSKKADLLEHCSRIARSLPCYANCTKQELLEFAVARGLITVTSRRVASKPNLQKILFEADAQPTFSKFGDLPAEIRTMIYELYIDAFAHDPDTLRPPPLAQSNSQMREEVLPVFYTRAIFNFSFLCNDELTTLRAVGPTRRLLKMIETSHSMVKLQRVRVRVGTLSPAISWRDDEPFRYEFLADVKVNTGKFARSRDGMSAQGFEICSTQIVSYEAMTFTSMLESALRLIMGKDPAENKDGKKPTGNMKALGSEELTQIERWMPPHLWRWGFKG